jgi:SAM-dependent methyltransferase
MGMRASRNSKLIYGLTIFSSAFLVFQVQPILGKMIMPWFGGAAGVWIVCLMFFQTVLLLGYLYAHLLTRKFRPRTQGRIHAALLAASFLTLPILPKNYWKPTPGMDPVWHILSLLGVTVGLPYLLLCATSPLLQAWQAQKQADSALYRLYAVSNAGSMLALLSYPIVVEPWVSTSHQGVVWSLAYGAVALLCLLISLTFPKQNAIDAPADSTSAPDWEIKILWMSLAACGSALLLSITNHLSQNVASVPLLWVIPLALYLLTFILCFEGRAWYRRNLFLRLLGLALGAMAYSLGPMFAGLPLTVLIALYCSGLFICCMFCHGELARRKPDPLHLTSFYLMSALGGAMGAVFVAVLAPRIFSGYYELRIALGSCAVLALVVHHRDPQSPFYKARWQPGWLVMVVLALAVIVGLGVTGWEDARSARVRVRNFYGVLRVVDQVEPNVVLLKGDLGEPLDGDARFKKLMNGTIDHGLQFQSPARRNQPTCYYGPDSGAGVVLKSAAPGTPQTVGVIGLGAGTLAAYGRSGDRYRFYEINPLVVRMANEEFSFLRDSPAKIEIARGDARLSLENEQPQGFDVLVVDAFSGDAIPVHLLTREAFELYFRHLKPDGLLAVHISNQYLNLAPVVGGAARRLGKDAVRVKNEPDAPREIYRATWILVGNQQGFLRTPEAVKAGKLLTAEDRQLLWTDDYSSLFKILK